MAGTDAAVAFDEARRIVADARETDLGAGTGYTVADSGFEDDTHWLVVSKQGVHHRWRHSFRLMTLLH
jgi:hypothetical protein